MLTEEQKELKKEVKKEIETKIKSKLGWSDNQYSSYCMLNHREMNYIYMGKLLEDGCKELENV